MRKGHALLATLIVIGTLAGCRVSARAKQAAVRAASSAFFHSVLALESKAPASQSTIKPAPTLPDGPQPSDVADSIPLEPAADAALGALPVPGAHLVASDFLLPRSTHTPFRLASLVSATNEPAPLVALELDDAATARTARSWALSGRSLRIRTTIDVDRIRTAVDAKLSSSSCALDRALAPRLSTALRNARIQLEMAQAVERADDQCGKNANRSRLIVFASSCLVQDAATALGNVGVATAR